MCAVWPGHPVPCCSLEMSASSPRAQPASPLPVRESGSSSAALPAHWPPAFAQSNPQPFARSESLKESNSPAPPKNPRCPSRPAKYKTPVAPHPAAASATPHLQVRPAACSAPASPAAPDRSPAAIPRSLASPFHPVPPRPRTSSLSLAARFRKSARVATVPAAPAPPISPSTAPPYPPVAAGQGSTAPLQAPLQTILPRATSVLSGSSLCASGRPRNHRHHIARPERHDAAPDRIRDTRHHPVDLRAVRHRHARNLHRDCRRCRRPQLPYRRHHRRRRRSLESFRQLRLHQVPQLPAQPRERPLRAVPRNQSARARILWRFRRNIHTRGPRQSGRSHMHRHKHRSPLRIRPRRAVIERRIVISFPRLHHLKALLLQSLLHLRSEFHHHVALAYSLCSSRAQIRSAVRRVQHHHIQRHLWNGLCDCAYRRACLRSLRRNRSRCATSRASNLSRRGLRCNSLRSRPCAHNQERHANRDHPQPPPLSLEFSHAEQNTKSNR